MYLILIICIYGSALLGFNIPCDSFAVPSSVVLLNKTDFLKQVYGFPAVMKWSDFTLSPFFILTEIWCYR